MKSIISPGFAKSGTTLLHHMLSKCPNLAPPVSGKELNVFGAELVKKYLGNFRVDNSEHVATLEFSPTYFAVATRERRRAILARIKREVSDPIIVIAIRSPVERAISHYIHLVQDFGRFGRGRYVSASRNMNEIYAFNFEAAVAADPAVGLDMAEVLEEVYAEFGIDDVLLFFLETDGRDMRQFLSRLSEKVGKEIVVPNAEAVPKVHVGKGVPNHFYSEADGSVLNVDGTDYRLPGKTLYIASDHGHVFLNDIDPLVGRSWCKASSIWTTEYDRTLLDRVQKWHFAEMAANLDAAIALSPDAVRAPRYAELTPKAKVLPRVAFSSKFLAKMLEPNRAA